MKSLWHLSSIAFALACLQGCDVSNSGSSGNSQEPDPVVVDFPIAYIERPIPLDEDGIAVADNILDPLAFNPGARLIVKDRASVPADFTVITDIAFSVEVAASDTESTDTPATFTPPYDVKDLSLNSDASKLIFAMRAPEIADADEEDQPTWNIWEYNLETAVLRRIIESDIIAEEGQDISPAYLPDDRIVFSSTRQRRSRAVLLDENKPQFAALTEDREETEALVLHTMNDDGSDVKQITFNQSHDLQPSVLSDGRIIFLRWDNYLNSKDRLSLYTVRPDGTDVSLAYGFHSQNTGSDNAQAVFAKPRELPDGRVQVSLKPRLNSRYGGDIVAIDIANFIEANQTVDGNEGVAQESLVSGQVRSDGNITLSGSYNSAYPIDDGTGRQLASWSPCQLRGYKLGIFINGNSELINDDGAYVNRNGDPLDETESPVVVASTSVGNYPCTEKALALGTIQIAPPVYGLWIYDPITDTQAPVVLPELDTIFTEAIVIEARPLPDYLPGILAGIDYEQSLADENVGILHIRSVYDLDGIDISPAGINATANPNITPATERPARFLRLLKAVSYASEDVIDFDNSAYGRAGNQMKDILGYVPIEPDGSVMVKVPADVAFTFSILNADGKRVTADGSGDIGPRHEYWLTLRAGETRQCTGCHSDADSEVAHGRADAEHPSLNTGATGGGSFPGTQLIDANGFAQLAPEVGETMAQYFARVNGVRTPAMNITDYQEWTDDGIRPRAPVVDLNFRDLSTSAPTNCGANWNSLCRSVINYMEHIQPLWDLDRRVFDDDDMLVADYTCTSCHNSRNADGALIIPAGNEQLNLSGEQSPEREDYATSYASLLFGNLVLEVDERTGAIRPETEIVVIDGEIQYQMIQLVIDTVAQFEALDADGKPQPAPADNTDPALTLVRDENDNLVPYMVQELEDVDGVLMPIPVRQATGNRAASLMSPNGALASDRFYSLFEEGGSHLGRLNGAELKLIAEWLDIGGQYYNNPFEAP